MRKLTTILAAAVLSVGLAAAADLNINSDKNNNTSDNNSGEYIYVSAFEDGSAVARHTDGRYYVVSEDLQQLGKFGYEYIADFVPGIRITSAREGAKCGFIGVDGQLRGAMDYDMIRLVNGQLFECAKGGRSFIVSAKGERIDGQEYEYLQYINFGNYFVAKQNGRWITLDDKGKRLSDTDFEQLVCLKDGVLVAFHDNFWWRVSPQGEWIKKIDVKSRVLFNKWGLGILQAVRRCLVVDEDISILDDRFDDVLEFGDRGLFRFRIGSQMGYIDGRARELVPASNCVAGEFFDGIAVSFNIDTKRYAAYDMKGKEPFDASKFAYLSDFGNNCAIARQHGSEHYGIIDTRGNWLCAEVYDSIQVDSMSFRRYIAVYKGQTRSIDREGNIRE